MLSVVKSVVYFGCDDRVVFPSCLFCVSLVAVIVVLGAGFGGITAALELKRLLGDRERVVLVDRRRSFLMGLRKVWLVTGRGTRAEGERPIASLAARGIEVREASVESVDPQRRRVGTDAGVLDYDWLVVATGAEPRPDLIPGWPGGAFNLYDPADAERLGARVAVFDRGRISIAIAGLPYKCPPGPYECAMELESLFRERGTRAAVSIDVTTPTPISLPVLGKKRCDQFEMLLRDRSIGLRTGAKVAAIEGTRIRYESGDPLEADLLIVVPPHRAPAAVRPLCDGGWIRIDPKTMRTGFERVYAAGDVTEIPLGNGLMLPKAGVFAESQGRVAAANIAAEILGTPPAAFDGAGACFAEVGDGRAVLVQGKFLEPGGPEVDLRPPAVEFAERKREFERERLRSWFET